MYLRIPRSFLAKSTKANVLGGATNLSPSSIKRSLTESPVIFGSGGGALMSEGGEMGCTLLGGGSELRSH